VGAADAVEKPLGTKRLAANPGRDAGKRLPLAEIQVLKRRRA